MRFFRNANYDFLGLRKRAYVFSGLMLLVGIVALVLHGGPQYGVDFTGGTLLQVQFTGPTTVGDLRTTLAAAGMENAQIQQLGDTNEYLIRTQAFEGIVEEVDALLGDAYGEDGFTMSADAVGPKVGSELQRKAAIAILMSFALTLVYLAFRFEWRFGIAAIIATFHDITITFGFISLFNVEITLATVAAILTILGYSLNDTIVVFDRIRENLKKRRKDRYQDILNSSINETLPRTVLTSGTTLATLVALFILGGAVVRPFALVLILGIVIGTYSSIFVASPLLLEIENRSRHKEKKNRG
ncbi:MAG: protein translocase subunit SecF [Candidatus Palauibacterales bacterium]|jgi:preprotein translocase subunit SecF|nr:protein translocase subunit SecF [Candidatus Palauibacterales bacterium]